MKTIFYVALVMSIGLTGVTSAQEPDRMPPRQLVEPQVPNMRQKAQEKFEAKLGLRIDEMKTVCDLSDAQVKKLNVASKGAVIEAISTMENKIKQMKEMMVGQRFGEPRDMAPENDQQDGINQGGGDARSADGNADEAEELEAEMAFQIQMGGDFGFEDMFGDSIKAEDTKIWKRTVENTLTDEQLKKYEAVVAERRKFRRAAAVQSFVAKVDGKLLLSADQRKQLTEFIDKEYGKELTEFVAEMGGFVFFGGGPGQEKPLEKNSPIRKILSKNQQTIWEKAVAHELDMMRDEAGMNGFQFQMIDVPEMK